MKKGNEFRMVLVLMMAMFAAPFVRAQVTWTGPDMTWDQPDTDSFDVTYNSGNNVSFAGASTGTITVGSGVTPGTLTFTHSSGAYRFIGTPFDAGANPLIISGAGTVEIGNQGATTYAAGWGNTVISGGGMLSYTRGNNTSIGGTNGTITLNNGTLQVVLQDNAHHLVSYSNPIFVDSGGGLITAYFPQGASRQRFIFNGAISGSGPLRLRSDGGTFSDGAGIRLGGNNSGYTGAAQIVSTWTTPQFTTTQPVNVVWFNSSTAMLTNAASVTARDGGVLGVRYHATDSDLANVAGGPRGGIGAEAGTGSLNNVSNPMQYVGPGGFLVLDYYSSTVGIYGDSSPLALNNNAVRMQGRNVANSTTTETVGDMTISGGSFLLLASSSSTSGVRIRAANLATPIAGSSLLIQYVGAGFGNATQNSTIIVDGSKPAPVNGMITPSIQAYSGGNTTGFFVTWDDNNRMIPATATSTDINTAGPTDIVSSGNATLSTSKTIHALLLSGTLNVGGNTLTLGSGGLIMGSDTITNGTIDFGSQPGVIGAYNAAAQAQINATISGSAGLTITGISQSLNIDRANTFTGGLFVNGGTVQLRHVNAANGNDVAVNAFGRLAVGAGTSASPTVIGGLTGDGRVTSHWQTNGNYHLRISPTSGVYVFNGHIANVDGNKILHIQKAGNGTQVFGPESVGAYTGTTQVLEGTLLIHGNFSGATGSVTIASGATLGGTGIIGGNTTTSSGSSVISPGASAGTLTFNQNLDLSAGATLNFELGTPVTNQDLIVVNGTLTGSTAAGGLTFNFSGLSGFAGYTPYKLFSFNSVSGLDYSDLNIGSSPWPLDTTYGSGGWQIDSDALYVQFIPEPGTTGVLMLGVAALVLRRRLRRE